MPKSSKSRKSSRKQPSTSTSSVNTSTNTSKPFTPLRRFFFKLELLGSSPSIPSFLGKRRREELPDHEAGFQHLHAYDHGANVEKALDSRHIGEDADTGITTSTEVYAQDGTRKWTTKPAGPRSHKQSSAGPTVESASQSTTVPHNLTMPNSVPHSCRKDRTTRVALQNVDTFLGEDAVIITALDSIPFNCHEELISMSREELVSVALDLNSKLPQALAIDTSEERPLTFIRNAIEVLVGIRPEVPAAPLRVGKMKIPTGSDEQPRFLKEFSFEKMLEDISPLTTPLTSRKRVGGNRVSGLSDDILRVHPQRLETLEEEEMEEELGCEDRVGSFGRKRRRLSNENEDSDIAMSCDLARSPVRPHSNLLQPPPRPKEPIDTLLPRPPTPSRPSPPRRVLRSHSRRFRSNNQVADNFSTALASAMLESGYEARARRRRRRTSANGNIKRNRQTTSKSSTTGSASSDDQRNSIAFPVVQSSSCVINSRPRQASSESNGGNTSTGSSNTIVSLSLDKSSSSSSSSTQSSQYAQRSRGESDSPLLSTNSAYSLVSKSVCTRGRIASSTTGDSGATSKEERGGLMDVSL